MVPWLLLLDVVNGAIGACNGGAVVNWMELLMVLLPLLVHVVVAVISRSMLVDTVEVNKSGGFECCE